MVHLFGEHLTELIRFFRKDKVQETQPTTEPEPEPNTTPSKEKERPISRLTIKFNDKSVLSWTHNTIDNYAIPNPWHNFYKWYFGRPQSKYFVMHHAKGQTMFKREDIRLFAVEDL